MGHSYYEEWSAPPRAVSAGGRGDPHGAAGIGCTWRAVRVPATGADSKLGHMSGERTAWLRLLEPHEIAQLHKRIEAKGANNVAAGAQSVIGRLR